MKISSVITLHANPY